MSWATPLEVKWGRAVNEHTVGSMVGGNQSRSSGGATQYVWHGNRWRVIGGHQPEPTVSAKGRENMTICADGTHLASAVVFKGQAFQTSWKQDNPEGIA
jgi:hypothetical protein